MWENAQLPWLLSCPAAQNPLPLRTLWASWRWRWRWCCRRAVVDGVVVVERDEEGEVALSMGGVGAGNRGLEVLACWDGERSCTFGAPVGDEQCVGRSEPR